jgi:ABC-type multidrug transport system fused ATPase/permease subunit
LLVVFKERIMYDAQVRYFCHLQSLPMNFFRNYHSGYLLSRFREVRQADGILTTVLLNGVTNLTTLIIATAAMTYIDKRVALAAFATIPALIWVSIYLGKRIRKLVVEMSELAGVLGGNVVESFSSLLVVRALGLQRRQTEKVQEGLLATRKINIQTSILATINGVARGGILGVGLALVVSIGGYEVIMGRMTIGEIVAITALLTYLYTPVLGLVGLNQELQSALASVDRLYKHLGIATESGEEAWQMETGTAATIGNGLVSGAPAVAGEGLESGANLVEFRDVSFAYDSQPVLKGLNLGIRPGSVVALVGHSGAGKSTLMYLLLRLYERYEGEITIGGQNIREISKTLLRRQIALVPQEPILFQGNLRENIECGLGSFTSDKLDEALRKANAYDLVENLPDKLDTVVGERGLSLSGGERQRICIARAFLRNPEIVILDEATSSVDSTSEALIQESIRNLTHDKTVLIIGHRLSTVMASDEIAVLHEGRIVERGSHQELFSKDGEYTKLYKDQCSEMAQENASVGS